MIKRLLYTCGEPSGIGPDLAILHSKNPHKSPHQFVAIGDPQVLTERAQQLGSTLQLKEIDLDSPPHLLASGELGIVPVTTAEHVIAGKLNPSNADYVLNTLDLAITACADNKAHAMVTGPVQKSVINDAGIPFSGHTEYLAEKTQTQQVVMMLATEGLRVALATTHLPLKDVAGAISTSSLSRIIRILNTDLIHKFGLSKPNILVCGLNPHAGENGHLGNEEIEIISPTLKQLENENIFCQGPLPADTLFTEKYLKHADAVLAMYHDQGLPVLKYKGFGAAANITLGLPIIRTSVDHGTALDLAGTGNIDTGSLSTAVDYALAMNTQDKAISQ